MIKKKTFYRVGLIDKSFRVVIKLDYKESLRIPTRELYLKLLDTALNEKEKK